MKKPVRIDISHRTRRYQQDIVTEDDLKETGDKKDEITIPINVTLESAIAFYEQHADGKFEVLYKRTANWLKMLFKSTIPNQSMAGTPDSVRAFLAEREARRDAEKEENMKE